MTDSPVVVALDYDNADAALALANRLNPSDCRLKVGKELFTSSGPQVVERIMALGFDVFLDLKFHDIPNTCAKAVKAAAEMGVWMVNVHASGGRRMMDAAAEALSSYNQAPLLIGVTVLTSMDAEDLNELGVTNSPEQQVMALARLTKQSGLDGIVCSAQEAKSLRQALDDKFCLVTPGIRPQGSDANDQRRIVTPKDAVSLGSDYLVIGRPITQAENPAQACADILQSLK